MDHDFDQINHFIYKKINNYNEKFEEFKKNLDIQDNKIKVACEKKVKDSIKKNPKKMAQQFADLTVIGETDDTSENTYELKNNNSEDIERIIKGGKLKGGNLDINYNNDYIESEVEILEEDEKIVYDNSNDSYKTFVFSIFFGISIYIIIYLCLVLFEFPIHQIFIFNPLVELTERIYPDALRKSIK